MDKHSLASVVLSVGVAWWFLSPRSLPLEMSVIPPLRSLLDNATCDGEPWPDAVNFSDRDRASFERDGFVILRDFLPSRIVVKMLAWHAHWCEKGTQSPHWHCKNEDVWARTDIYRDFLYFSPLGRTVRNLLKVRGVRIYGDHITEMRSDHSGIFYHFDNIYYGGVMGEFHASSKGAIVFLFLTGINHTGAGGSLMLQPGAHRDTCVMAGVQEELQAPCRQQFYEQAVTFSFNAGDALILHPLMPHATQSLSPVAPRQLRRISYLARIVETDAIFCTTDTSVRETGKVDCKHQLQPGDKAHDVCYQQIDPLLVREIIQRMDSDWYTERCNVAAGWRYTRVARMKLQISALVSQLRIRLRGGTPIGLERAECIYSPEDWTMLGSRQVA